MNVLLLGALILTGQSALAVGRGGNGLSDQLRIRIRRLLVDACRMAETLRKITMKNVPLLTSSSLLGDTKPLSLSTPVALVCVGGGGVPSAGGACTNMIS